MPDLLHQSTYGDGLQCYALFTPNWNPDAYLDKLVVKSKTDKRPHFIRNSFDAVMWETKEMHDGNLFKNNKEKGYTDVKWMYYGNKNFSPITFKAEVKKEGYIFICEPSKWWSGALRCSRLVEFIHYICCYI
jgi:hypothetical protein